MNGRSSDRASHCAHDSGVTPSAIDPSPTVMLSPTATSPFRQGAAALLPVLGRLALGRGPITSGGAVVNDGGNDDEWQEGPYQHTGFNCSIQIVQDPG